jgi:hypothetical protein
MVQNQHPRLSQSKNRRITSLFHTPHRILLNPVATPSPVAMLSPVVILSPVATPLIPVATLIPVAILLNQALPHRQFPRKRASCPRSHT